MGREDFILLGELISKMPSETAFEGIGAHQCRSLLKCFLCLRAQKKAIAKFWKSFRLSRRLTLLRRDLLQLRLKKEIAAGSKVG